MLCVRYVFVSCWVSWLIPWHNNPQVVSHQTMGEKKEEETKSRCMHLLILTGTKEPHKLWL